MRQEIFAGIATGLALVPGLIVIPSILSRTGMDFAGAYTACVLISIIGTLLLALAARIPMAAVPQVSVAGWLSYVVVISHGHSWQAVLGASFLAAVLCLLLTVVFREKDWRCFIPEHLGKVLPLGLGLMLVLIGLRQGHLLVPATTGFFSVGDLTDPVAYHSLMGILVTAALFVCRVPGAMLLGMLLVAAISLAEGFWVLPVAPFLQPELEKTAFQLDVAGALELPETVISLAILGLVLTQGISLGLGHSGDRKPAGLLFGTNVVGAFLGAFPLAPAPESAVGTGDGGRTGKTALAAAGVMGVLLFCEPFLAALASYGAITAPSLVISGCMLARHIEFIAGGETSRLLSACALCVLMPITQSVAVGLGMGVVLYVFLTLWEGQWKQLPTGIWIMAAMFLLLFLLEAF